jgi:NhaA family Na+:H+ antiporter
MEKALKNGTLNSEKLCGFLLFGSVLFSMILSNMPFGGHYQAFWQTTIGGFSFLHIINDGLMTLFFLMIGLELEREIYVGELKRFRNAMLPFWAAIGGMFVPALIYFATTDNTLFSNGIGIPIATDIAFAVGLLSLLGNRVPTVLKIFLVALSIIDDLGAILIIAFFYAGTVCWLPLMLALLIFGVLLVLNRTNVLNLTPYIIGGLLMWVLMLKSGIHPTLTGVLLAFAVPFRAKDVAQCPSAKMMSALSKPVAFIVLPLFALANTAITISSTSFSDLFMPSAIGAFLGLVVGKPIGILLFSLMAVRFGVALKPKALHWSHIAGVGFISGIGFTMSIFITLLSFDVHKWVEVTKLAVLIASVVSGVVGYAWLRLKLKPKAE